MPYFLRAKFVAHQGTTFGEIGNTAKGMLKISSNEVSVLISNDIFFGQMNQTFIFEELQTSHCWYYENAHAILTESHRSSAQNQEFTKNVLNIENTIRGTRWLLQSIRN